MLFRCGLLVFVVKSEDLTGTYRDGYLSGAFYAAVPAMGGTVNAPPKYSKKVRHDPEYERLVDMADPFTKLLREGTMVEYQKRVAEAGANGQAVEYVIKDIQVIAKNMKTKRPQAFRDLAKRVKIYDFSKAPVYRGSEKRNHRARVHGIQFSLKYDDGGEHVAYYSQAIDVKKQRKDRTLESIDKVPAGWGGGVYQMTWRKTAWGGRAGVTRPIVLRCS